MENLVIEKEIAFYSMDSSDALGIETLKIHVTPTDVANIKKVMELLKTNRFIERVDVERFVVYSDSVYYYAQNKWHSGDQIESEAIDCEELGIA